ncbi:bestrophin-like domain [Singulisphaera rosea]
MSMYWIYDLPNWLLGVLTVAVFVGPSLLGLFASRPLMRRFLKASAEYNDIVSYFFAGVGVFYGLALGMIAVATWSNFTDSDGQVSKEVASLAEFYRDECRRITVGEEPEDPGR